MTNSNNNQPWGEAEKKNWLAEQTIKRSYSEQVLSKIEALKADYDVSQYGALDYDADRYPLFLIKSRNWDTGKKTVLITGGVHGYETSGVHGALRFVETALFNYTQHYNFVVAPCVSPWGYETINRWNPYAVDPNRSFKDPSPAQEAGLLMQAIGSIDADFICHIDLHETTDTDNTVFRPALAARDAIEQSVWDIPDGFYLVGNEENPQDDFQKAMIDSVKKITHIAPADDTGGIIGKKITQEGVINYPTKPLGLCAGLTDSPYTTTTEVYPDSPKVTDEECILAQVAAVTGGLDWLVGNS
ncbi:MAG: M14 family metallocarboxypeptidase [Gammaproteobacteria bacterium]|nr:M14 family metallocarboxypeptidase [Gammaproteobacteria bacterium]MDH5630766.1 M14 family metallocarboxypeptidase [Gammaproteobacteria bacterium]